MTKPSISISTAFNYSLPIHEQIPFIAKVGFSHISIGMNLEYSGILSSPNRKHLSSLLTQNNLSIDTIHGPRLDLPESVEQISAIGEVSLEMGNPVIVVHPCPFILDASDLPSCVKMVLNNCEKLAPFIENYKVKLAMENLFPGAATDLLEEVLPRVDPDHFGFCYDSAHDQIEGPKPFDLLSRLSNRLLSVHLSDRIREYVDHVPPGEGFIDWRALSTLLKESSYKQPLLFEVNVTHSSRKETLPFLELVYKQACWVHSLIFGA